MSVTEELETLHAQWCQAWLDTDEAAVDRLMAPDYRSIDSAGRISDRATALRAMHSPAFQVYHREDRDVSVQPLGRNAALIVHIRELEGARDGMVFRERQQCTIICHKRGGQWQVAMEQCSAVGGEESWEENR